WRSGGRRRCLCSSRRRHTRSTRDWSSDVCSSDLRAEAEGGAAGPGARGEGRPGARLPGGAAARGEAARGGTVTPGAWLALAAPTVCLLLPPPWVAAQGAPATQAPPAAAPAARGPSFDQLAKKAAAAKEAGQLDDAIRYYGQAL